MHRKYFVVGAGAGVVDRKGLLYAVVVAKSDYFM